MSHTGRANHTGFHLDAKWAYNAWIAEQFKLTAKSLECFTDLISECQRPFSDQWSRQENALNKLQGEVKKLTKTVEELRNALGPSPSQANQRIASPQLPPAGWFQKELEDLN